MGSKYNIDPGEPGPPQFNFFQQFKWVTYNNISMAPSLNEPPTIIFTQGGRALTKCFPTKLNV